VIQLIEDSFDVVAGNFVVAGFEAGEFFRVHLSVALTVSPN
jgi:hypothetical protein